MAGEAPKRERRSRGGCLTCRKRRRKCDEKKPRCLGCLRSNFECQWPEPASHFPLAETSVVPAPNATEHYPDTTPITHCPVIDASDHGNPKSMVVSDKIYSIHHSLATSHPADPGKGAREPCETGLNSLFVENLASSGRASGISHRQPKTAQIRGKAPSSSIWNIYNYEPAIIWPPLDTRSGHVDDSNWDPEGVMPLVKLSINTLGGVEEPDFQVICHFYSVFLPRFYYDYNTTFRDTISVFRQRFNCTGSARYGMLSVALLFHSNYSRSSSTEALREQSKRFHRTAVGLLQVDLERTDLSPALKIKGLTEVMAYDFFLKDFPGYYHRLKQAAYFVRMIYGGTTLDLLALSGEQTFDIRVIASCDIMCSMALSRPTLLNYNTEIGVALRKRSSTDCDAGIESLFGFPDDIAFIIAQISSLRRPELSGINTSSTAKQIEQALRSWQPRVDPTKPPLLKIARLGVQEIWRHTAILYLYQTAYRYGSSHHVIRDSVKQIIQIASTIKPGGNPDCFLYLPYFVAGSFARSAEDRHLLQTRLLGSGNEDFLRSLAAVLEDLWKKTDATGQHVGWSQTKPLSVMF